MKNSKLKSLLTHPYADWGIFLLAFLVISAGIGLRDPWPADEPRFALVAKQMVESGQWLFPMRGAELYADKPPLFMWLLAVGYQITGSMRMAFLLPSLGGALLTLGLLMDLTRRLWNPLTARTAGLILLLGLVQFTLQARVAQIDALLCAWVTLSIYGFWRHCVLGPHLGWYAIGGFAAGLGVITKGVGIIAYLFFIPYVWARLARMQPLTVFGVAANTVANQNSTHGSATPTANTYSRLHAAHWLIAPLMTLLAISLWFIPMMLAVNANPTTELLAYRDNILFHQTSTRYFNAWHHVQPFWYFVVQIIPWAWFPVSLLLPWLGKFIYQKIQQHDSRFVLACGTIVLIIVFFSLSPGKREVYILPATPWVALLAAVFLREKIIPKVVHAISLILLAVLGMVAACVALLPEQIMTLAKVAPVTFSLTGLRTMAAVLALGSVALIFWPQKIQAPHAWWRILPWLGIFWISLGWLAYPLLNSLRSSAPMMQSVANVAQTHPVALLQWKEQYLLFAPNALKLHTFPYKTPAAEEITLATHWLSTHAQSYVMLPEELLPALFSAQCNININLTALNQSQALRLGEYHREVWWLFKGC